ncbi:MAG: hypothetical protein ACE5F9_03655 [Phycisphaerae bacterium]
MRGRFVYCKRVSSRSLPLYREYRRHTVNLMPGSAFRKITTPGVLVFMTVQVDSMSGCGVGPRWKT